MFFSSDEKVMLSMLLVLEERFSVLVVDVVVPPCSFTVRLTCDWRDVPHHHPGRVDGDGKRCVM